MLQRLKCSFTAVLLLVGTFCRGQVSEALFRNPPPEAKVSTFWHWMNGNVNAEAITSDLEYMASAGYGEAVLFNVHAGIERGPVDFGSEQWKGLVRHACSESARLGLSLGMHNSPGYSAVGGPWIVPSESMKQLTWSQTTVHDKTVVCQLPRPWCKLGYYEDIRVFAWPSSGCERPETPDSVLVDGSMSTEIRLDSLRHEMAFDFGEAVPLRRISLRRGTREPPLDPHDGPRDYGSDYLIECSDDGMTFRSVASLHSLPLRSLDAPTFATFAPIRARYWKMTTFQNASVAEVEFYDLIDSEKVIDVTGFMDRDGLLTWDAPYEATWTILRIGQTTTGKMTTVSPESGTGLEVDKLSSRGADLQFDLFLDPLFRYLSPYVGTTLKTLMIDSWEAGGQDWTDDFASAFEKKRGYSIGPMLLAMTGRIVDSVENTESFLKDVRRTKQDLFNEFLTRFAERTHRWNLLLAGEPYGDGDFVREEYASLLDLPMSEWWTHYVYGSPATTRFVATEARKRDISLIGAECYTGTPFNSKFTEHPYGMKALGDWMMTLGTSRFYLHSYALQPWKEPRHIMTMGPFGSHLDRNSAWAEESVHWNMYNARCAAMLQQGRWMEGGANLRGSQDDSQLHFTHRRVGEEDFYFVCNHRRRNETVLAELDADSDLIPEIWDPQSGQTGIPLVYSRNGNVCRTVFPLGPCGSAFVVFKKDGNGKHVPVLPEVPFKEHPTYKGAFTLSVWVKPETYVYGSRGQILYGGDTCFGVSAGTNAIRIFDGKTLVLEWAHPVSGWTMVTVTVSDGLLTLYVDGEEKMTSPCRPDLTIAPDTDFSDARYVASFEGDSDEPLVLGSPLTPEEIQRLFHNHETHTEMDRDWDVVFPDWSGAPDIHLDYLQSLHLHPNYDVAHFGGTAVYRKSVVLRPSAGQIVLDLGRVEHIASLSVNGHACGVRWMPPYSFDITDYARDGINDLEVKVTSLYANRLVGDALLPEDARKLKVSWQHYDGKEALIETGLTGGVSLLQDGNPVESYDSEIEIAVDTKSAANRVDNK